MEHIHEQDYADAHERRRNERAHGRSRDAGQIRRLAIVLALTTGYMAVEVVGGLLTNSLALLADAGHMLTDAAAIGLALFAAWLTRRPRNARKTFGYYRAEILAALANAATLILIVALIGWEAWQRLRDPPPVMGREMMMVAVVGLLVNLAGARILGAGHDAHGLNVRGVFWHIVGDALGSVGVIVAGILMAWRGWLWADPVASLAIGVIILFGAVRLTRESVNVLMEGAPEGIDLAEVRKALGGLPGVREVYDLHAWTVTSDFDALSVHLVVDDLADNVRVLCAARDLVQRRFGIGHSTIQVEPLDFEHRECEF